MNKDELQGGGRYLGGKIESAVGDALDSPNLKIDGVVDQVAGAVQHSYGRARSATESAIESAPELTEEARERLKTAGERLFAAAERNVEVAATAVRHTPMLWVSGAALAGYAAGWLIHGRRDQAAR